jgi:VWFA-related protein
LVKSLVCLEKLEAQVQPTRRAFAVFLIGVVALLHLTASAAGPQQPQVPGAFSTRITLVPLDVRVLDEDGKPVTDLQQQDFTITEDNVQQEIRHFSAHGLTPETPEPGAGLMLRQAPGSELTPQNHRIFLIVLGRGRLREPTAALEGLTHFVRAQLLPQDEVAILAYNRATAFTTDHEKVAQVVDRFKRQNDAIENDLRHYFRDLQAVYGSKVIPGYIQARRVRSTSCS